MILSPFTPLFFPPLKVDGVESRYVQTFAKDDVILIELFGAPSETLDFHVYSEPGHTEVSSITSESYTLSSTVKLHVIKLQLPEGCYTVMTNGRNSTMFKVTEDELALKDTVLIKYSPADNRTRADVAAIVDSKRVFFSFRVPGGFKDGGWSFSVDNEQFVTNDGDIMELYGRESTQMVLTIGHSAGVPIWFGQLINRLLTCKYVFIDGLRFARFESSVPEKTQVHNEVNSFVFTQNLQQIKYVEPTIDLVS